MKAGGSIAGLQVRNGSFYLRKMVKGVNIQYTIGRVEELSLEEAEQIALDLIKDVRKNGELALHQAIDRKKARLPSKSNQPETFGDVARQLIEIGRTRGTKKTGGKKWKASSVKKYEGMLAHERLKNFLDQPIKSITSRDIFDWYETQAVLFPHVAVDNDFKRIRRIFSFAQGNQLIETDPTVGAAKSEYRTPAKVRDGRLSIETGEHGKFAIALIDYKPDQPKLINETLKHILMVELQSGRRTSEIKYMEWSWVDFPNRQIVIPAEAVPGSPFQGTKNRTDFTLPMSRLVHTMMRVRHENRDRLFNHYKNEACYRFVFPGRNGTGPVRDLRGYYSGVLKFAGLPQLITHDLRRTFGAIAYKANPDLLSSQQAMGHKLDKVTADYIGEMDINEKRKLFQEVSDIISVSMPCDDLSVNGKALTYTGTKTLDENNISELDDTIYTADAVELLMFPKKIWRHDGWVEHDGIEQAVDFGKILGPPKEVVIKPRSTIPI